MSNVISINDMSVIFGKQQVLSKISLAIKDGECVAILGKSGVGKSTLLNAIAGFVPFFGRIKKPENIGFVFQNYSLFPWLSVKDNILFGIEGENHSEEYAKKLLESVGLADSINKFPFELSGGQRQRVAFARTLSTKPKLLLLDEPFGSLDYYTRLLMQKWLRRFLLKNNLAIILVTHDVEEALLLSDKIVILKQNRDLIILNTKFRLKSLNNLKNMNIFQKLKRKILNEF